jgi:hypothetical protein
MDSHQMGNAQNTYAQIGNAAISQPPDPTMTDQMMDRLEELSGALNDSANRLEILKSRFFGSFPAEASGKSGPAAVPNGRAEEMNWVLISAVSLAYQVQSLASELQRRL